MEFSNIAYHENKLKKISSIEVTIYMPYLDEYPIFKTRNRQVIYLFIYEYPLRDEFRSRERFDEIMKRALLDCEEIPKDLRITFENWTGWHLRINNSKALSNAEKKIFNYEQNERLFYWVSESKTTRLKDYYEILNNQKEINNLLYMRKINND